MCPLFLVYLLGFPSVSTFRLDIYVWNWMATYSEYQMRFYFSIADCSYNISGSVLYFICRVRFFSLSLSSFCMFACMRACVFARIYGIVCLSSVYMCIGVCVLMHIHILNDFYIMASQADVHCTQTHTPDRMVVLFQLLHVKIASLIQVDYVHVWSFNLNFVCRFCSYSSYK